MSPRSLYSITLLPRSDLSPSDPQDPFRFFHNEERLPLQNPHSTPGISLEVIDQDGNRRLDGADQYFYRGPGGHTLQLTSALGLNLLNYYLDPQILSRQGQGVLIHSQDLFIEPHAEGSAELGDLHEIPSEIRDEIDSTHAPYWESDGHLDLDILEGRRVYRPEENQRYTGWQGLGIFLNGRYVRNKLFTTGLVAGGFMLVEHLAGPAFIWHTYTNNFLSSIAGSFQHHPEWNATIRRGESLSIGSDVNDSVRRLANIRTAEARNSKSQDHLYWTFMSPIVLAACLADRNFRNFLVSPSILYRHFLSQFQTALPSLGRTPLAWLRNPLGLCLAALAGYGIYEVSSRWFETYGGLRRGTLENQIFSGTSTALVEMALLARTSRELQAMTGSGALTWSNLRTAWSLRPQWGVLTQIPEGSLLARAWQNSPRLQSLFARSFLPTVEVGGELGPTAILNRVGIPRVTLEARLPALTRSVTAETVLSRAAVATEGTALAEREGLVVAEELMAARRVRVVGLPLLGIAAGVGLFFGVGYGTGYFDDRHGPLDRLRELLGS